MLENKHSIENININFVDPNARLMMKALLSKKDNITLTSSFDHNLEIGGVSTGKGDAVQMLAKYLQIQPSNIMAVGDSPNDSSMLKLVGLPIAVANAKEEVKAVAKHIMGTNDEGGVAQAIQRFVL
jgi:HAD superfamily hydrolase (TIGR01484 family)